MKIGGWKTRSVFLRYDITELADLADAAARLDASKSPMRLVTTPSVIFRA
jgi:hypothetical protein